MLAYPFVHKSFIYSELITVNGEGRNPVVLPKLHMKLSHFCLSFSPLNCYQVSTCVCILGSVLWYLVHLLVLAPIQNCPNFYEFISWCLSTKVTSSRCFFFIGAFNILVPYYVHINFRICLSSRAGVKGWGGAWALDVGCIETIDQFEGIHQLYTVFQSTYCFLYSSVKFLHRGFAFPLLYLCLNTVYF